MLKHIKSKLYKIASVRSNKVKMHTTSHIGPFSSVWAPNCLDIGQRVYIGKFVSIECDGYQKTIPSLIREKVERITRKREMDKRKTYKKQSKRK